MKIRKTKENIDMLLIKIRKTKNIEMLPIP